MNVKLRTASELMTRELVMIDASESLRAAAALMSARHVHCLIVPPSDPKRCLGVITTKDIVQILCDGEPSHLDGLRVSDAMTSPAFCVQQEFLVVDCLKLMRMAGVRSVFVLDGARAVGILSFTDVLRALSSEASDD